MFTCEKLVQVNFWHFVVTMMTNQLFLKNTAN